VLIYLKPFHNSFETWYTVSARADWISSSVHS